MSCFQLTKKVCKKLASLMAKYWWSGSLDRRSLHWLSWDKLASPKACGGMGFRDLELFNLALLAKQAWRILQSPNSLSARILKSVYFSNNCILDADLGSHPSQIWRAIIEGRDLLKQGLIRRIGNGENCWKYALEAIIN